MAMLSVLESGNKLLLHLSYLLLLPWHPQASAQAGALSWQSVAHSRDPEGDEFLKEFDFICV